MQNYRWQLLAEQQPLSLVELEQIWLANRQLVDADQRELFFAVRDPLTISLSEVELDPDQIRLAIAHLQSVLSQDPPPQVLIFGDYDVDGNCATAILWQALKYLGLTATPFIPHRQKHGYGLTDRSLAAVLAAEKRPDLIITVDNGIVAHPALAELQRQKIDVIVTDHHQPEATLPPALAIVHSTQLCGAGVIWFFCRELLRDPSGELSPEHRHFLTSLLDLVCLATLADQMPVLGANRDFIKAGLEQLRLGRRVGLQQLCQVAKIDPAQITVESVDYGLAPRINAIGRLKNSLEALRLLCTKNSNQAAQLAAQLESTNQERRDLTQDMFDLAVTQAESQIPQQKIIIVASDQFHEGIIGLIASRLVEKFSRPTLVLAIGGEVIKGSARSLPGINITELMRQIRPFLLEIGGHPMAGGCALAVDQLKAAREALWQVAADQITSDQLQPTLTLEHPADLSVLNQNLLPVIEKFKPFGQGNPAPLLQLNNLRLVNQQVIGKDSRHLRLQWQDASSGLTAQTLLWSVERYAQLPKLEYNYDLVVEPSINVWRGKSSLQLTLIDFRTAQS